MAEIITEPHIRFKDFSGTWEKEKLGQLGETFTGLSGKTKADFGHGNGQYIPYMNVFSNAVVDPKWVEPVEIDDTQPTVKLGDVLFTTSSETPEEVGMSSVVLHNCVNTYLNSFCFGYRPKYVFNNSFLAYMLRSHSVRKDIVFLAQGISRYNISKKRVMEIAVPIPDINEQSQIGSYFQNLDSLITLHQRKHDKLITVKKAMLEKMFPKEGADAPEIRFKGFPEKWVQWTLGEILTEIRRPIELKDEHEYELVTVKRRNEGVVSRGKLKGRDILVKTYFELRSGDYIISKRQIVHGANGVVPQSLDKAIVSNEYLVAVGNDKITTDFFALISKLPYMYKLFFLSSYGIDIEKLVFDVADWKKRYVVVPCPAEQQRLTSFFHKLDSLISLQLRELDKLKNIKKACLEKMFV